MLLNALSPTKYLYQASVYNWLKNKHIAPLAMNHLNKILILSSFTLFASACIDPNTASAPEASDFQLHSNARVAALSIDYSSVDDRDGLDQDELKILTKRLYQEFNDSFDFIFFISNNDGSEAKVSTIPYSGNYSSIKNTITGIGQSLYDYTDDFGSAGKLQGIIHLAKHGSIKGGPSLHELMHRWGNFNNSTVQFFSHWGFSSAGIDEGGQLGGFAANTLVNLGANQCQANNGKSGSSSVGTFANDGNGLPYSDLELYLMGLKPANELSSFTINYFSDATWVDASQGTFTSTEGVKSLSFSEYQTELGGARNPDSTGAPKSFRILTVLLDSSIANEVDLSAIDQEVERFSYAGDDAYSLYNFYEATYGAATVNMDSLDSELK